MSDTLRRLKEYAELAGSDMMAVVDTDALREAADEIEANMRTINLLRERVQRLEHLKQ